MAAKLYTTEAADSFEDVERKIDERKVVIISTTYCPFCFQVKRLAELQNFSDTTVFEVDTLTSKWFHHLETCVLRP